MKVKLPVSEFLNPETIREGLPETIGRLRELLARYGMNTSRRIATYQLEPGWMHFCYAEDCLHPWAPVFRLTPRELTPEEKREWNLREFERNKKDRAKGRYLK